MSRLRVVDHIHDPEPHVLRDLFQPFDAGGEGQLGGFVHFIELLSI
jgi:hypothetical protein